MAWCLFNVDACGEHRSHAGVHGRFGNARVHGHARRGDRRPSPRAPAGCARARGGDRLLLGHGSGDGRGAAHDADASSCVLPSAIERRLTPSIRRQHSGSA